jgi:hypothetical protein
MLKTPDRSGSEIKRSAREQFRLPLRRAHDVQNWLPERKEFELSFFDKTKGGH